ncbi:glycosyltransferase [bacterium]|nr:glycosyltransferase [bacterium]
MAVTLSLAMIVKNEGDLIERALSCAKPICDEMIVVDTGSTDDTVAKAEAMGAKLAHFAWIDDFAAARNYSFSLCTGDWILWLDADDIITPENQRRIAQLKSQLDDSLDAIYLNYHHTASTHLLRERLIRRGIDAIWKNRVHEAIYGLIPARTKTFPDIFITHQKPPEMNALSPRRNLAILMQMLADGDESGRTLRLIARENYTMGNLNEAVAFYERYYATTPPVDSYMVREMLRLARAYASTGKDEKARESFGRAIMLMPDIAEVYYETGKYLVERKQWAAALPLFAAAISIPNSGKGNIDPEAYGPNPHDYISICYHSLGRYEQAIHHAEEALRLGVKDADRVKRNLKRSQYALDKLIAKA